MNKTLITLAVALCGATFASAVSLPDLPAVAGKNVKGYVHDGTNGVANAYVSDGFTITKTDANGAYYMATDPAAKFVFVILPSGYQIASVTNGVQKFYANIDHSASDARHDFELKAIGNDDSFTFMLHADTQPDTYFNPNVFSDLTIAYKDMQATATEIRKADGFDPLMLHMGDIIYKTATSPNTSYSPYMVSVRQSGFNVPMFVVPGNHDLRWVLDKEQSLADFHEQWGPDYYSFNRGKVHFIMLNNISVVKEGEYTKGISDEQMAWLKEDLKTVPAGSFIILSAHQPLTRNKSAKTAYGDMLDLLKPYKTFLLTGHLHRIFNNFPSYAANMRERNHTALGGYEWRSVCASDGTPNGYYIYTVNGTDISWKFKPTGKDADKNMFRIYEPGQFDESKIPAPEDAKVVEVNVWDWDEDWSVTWSLDGEEQGNVPRYDSHRDPMASFNYDNVPNRPTWSAADTYHMFHCDVPNTGSEVKVTVKDPFGRKLSKTIYLECIPGSIASVVSDDTDVVTTDIYSLSGVRLNSVAGYPQVETLRLESGVYILRMVLSDGTTATEKVIL